MSTDSASDDSISGASHSSDSHSSDSDPTASTGLEQWLALTFAPIASEELPTQWMSDVMGMATEDILVTITKIEHVHWEQLSTEEMSSHAE